VDLGIANSNALAIEIKKESAKTYISRPNPKFPEKRHIHPKLLINFLDLQEMSLSL